MPYNDANELPDDIRNVLPVHAQHIFKEAFNSAHEEYEDAEKRRTDDSREEVAFKVAWSAVKKEYEKGTDDKWHPKDI